MDFKDENLKKGEQMKKGLLTTLLILVLATGASAAGPAIYAGGGVSMPMGDWADFYKMGFGFGGGFGYPVTPQFEVVGKVFYNTFPVDSDVIEGGDFIAISFGADVHFYPMANNADESAFAPYLLGGIGMSSVKVKEITAPVAVPEGESETDLTFGFGAGFQYEMSPKMALWVEAKYTIISTEGASTSHLPIFAGIKFNLGE